MNRHHSRYDLIIVGSGIAGLYAALLAAPHGRVLLITKGALEESNTRYAQGGIAAALRPDDSPELHLRDTLAAGDGICDRTAVEALTRDAPRCIADLLQLGVPFDREGGDLAFTLEAAHSLPRVLHAGGDATGAGIEMTLARRVREAGVEIREGSLCTALLGDGRRVDGVELRGPEGRVEGVDAAAVLLASGGAGQLYARTTNPRVATGDGPALAYRAGAELMDLEFFQFHPTAFALPGAPSFLISEAVRGEGGVLRNGRGEAFMARYHPDRELAPRDVVARALHAEMTGGEPHLWLDITHLPPELIERRFPTIVAFCRTHGVDPVREPIPVAPAAHYSMGGVRTDVWGRTSLAGLFACGEVACTGVHGANRLASNSLLEGLVFARRAVEQIVRGGTAEEMDASEGELLRGPVAAEGEAMLSRQELAHLMWREGLARSAGGLRTVLDRLEGRGNAPDGGVPSLTGDRELANLTLLARLLAASALLREESRGAHFRTDFPRRSARWEGHIVVSRRGARLVRPMAGAGRTRVVVGAAGGR